MGVQFQIKSALILCLFCFSGLLLARAEDFAAFSGQTSAADINVRVDSTVGAEVICVLAKGEVVEVVREAYDWYKIRLPKTAPAYIKKELLECLAIPADLAVSPQKCLSAQVIKERVNVRLKPTETSWILGKIAKSTVVNIVADEGDWYKIQPVYQCYGWVNKKFINKEIAVSPAPLPAPLPAPMTALVTAETKKVASILTLTGKVCPYGIVLWRKATHKLITVDNKIYLLIGNRKSLDRLNGRQVKLTARAYGPATDKYPIVQIDELEALN